MALNVVNRTFTDYQARSLSFLLANSLDPMTVTYTVEPYFGFNLSTLNSVVKEGDGFYLTQGGWEDYGFVAGDTVTIYNLNGAGGTYTGAITYIDGSYLLVGTPPSAADDSYSIGTFSVSKAPEGFDFFFNLVKNSNPGNENSLIDGEVQRFTVDGVDALSVAGSLSMTRLGKQSGGSEMTAQITRIADVSSRKRYEIELTFKLFPWMDSEPFQAAECIKPWAKIVALPQYNNPSVTLTTINSQNGNTGWRNENWNGGVANYTFDSIAWTDDDSNPLTAFDYSQPSNFEIQINGAFTSGSLLNFKMFFPPLNDSEFKNLETNHEINTISAVGSAPIAIATPTTISSATHYSGAAYSVEDITVANNTTYATITGRIVPNADMFTLMDDRDDNDRLYRLWVRCENPALDYNSSDAINVECDYNTAIETPIPLGAYSPVYKDIFLNHYLDPAGDDCITEDDLLRETWLLLPLNTRYTQLAGRIWVVNTVTGSRFLVDEVIVPFDPYPTQSDGTIPFNYTANRGYKLPSLSEMLNVSFIRNSSIDITGYYGVEFKYPVISRWEYWLPQNNANGDFYGNKTKDWQHYSTGNWVMTTEVALQTIDNEEYSNIKQFTIRDYDDWAGTSVFSYELLDGTPITQPVQGEIIKVICTHTPDSMTLGAINVWGNITIEPTESNPRYLISSWIDHGTWLANPLQPLDGETTINVTDNLTNIVFECLFDSSKLNVSNGIKFTSRINLIPKTKVSGHPVTVSQPVGPPIKPLTINGNSNHITIEP